MRSWFARMGHWFDRLMGAILIALGLRLALGELIFKARFMRRPERDGA